MVDKPSAVLENVGTLHAEQSVYTCVWTRGLKVITCCTATPPSVAPAPPIVLESSGILCRPLCKRVPASSSRRVIGPVRMGLKRWKHSYAMCLHMHLHTMYTASMVNAPDWVVSSVVTSCSSKVSFNTIRTSSSPWTGLVLNRLFALAHSKARSIILLSRCCDKRG